nr:unnamed protein product [Callosobruchus chinensis]
MNNWSDEEKACSLTSMLRVSAAAILENLSSSHESEIGRLKKELQKVIEDAQKGVFGISVQQDDDVKLRQRGCDQAAQLRSENAKLKDTIMQLEDEHSRLRKELENSFRDAKKEKEEEEKEQGEAEGERRKMKKGKRKKRKKSEKGKKRRKKRKRGGRTKGRRGKRKGRGRRGEKEAD